MSKCPASWVLLMLGDKNPNTRKPPIKVREIFAGENEVAALVAAAALLLKFRQSLLVTRQLLSDAGECCRHLHHTPLRAPYRRFDRARPCGFAHRDRLLKPLDLREMPVDVIFELVHSCFLWRRRIDLVTVAYCRR